MGLLSNLILNGILKSIESELIEAAPQIKGLAINELREFADEIIKWTESKVNIDLNCDGKIGDDENE